MYGNAGTGKSTLASSFIKGVEEIVDRGGKYEPKDPIIHNYVEMFKVKHMNEKNKSSGEFYPLDTLKNLYIVEYPNPSDRKMVNELPNHSSMQYIFNNC